MFLEDGSMFLHELFSHSIAWYLRFNRQKLFISININSTYDHEVRRRFLHLTTHIREGLLHLVWCISIWQCSILRTYSPFDQSMQYSPLDQSMQYSPFDQSMQKSLPEAVLQLQRPRDLATRSTWF